MTDSLDPLTRAELGLEEIESDEIWEDFFEELEAIHTPEQEAAYAFDWKQSMEASLNALYDEWPMLLRWIPLFQVLVETVQAYLAFQKADLINRNAYLERVSALADSIFSADGIKGTDKESLARKKIGLLAERLQKVHWLNQAQIEGELKRILKELQSDLSHKESYSTIQLIFQEVMEEGHDNLIEALENKIQDKIVENPKLWITLSRQKISGNRNTLEQEARAVLRLADPQTRIQSEKMQRLFSRSLIQLSPFQPITDHELEVFIYIVSEPILPHLHSDFAKQLILQHIRKIKFTDLGEAQEAVEIARDAIFEKLNAQITADRLLSAELKHKIAERSRITLEENTHAAYLKCLADDADALLPMMPEGEKRNWLAMTLERAMLEQGEDYNEMRKALLENLRNLYWNLSLDLQEDFENLQDLLSNEVVGRKMLFFIRGRALPEEEQTSFFIRKESARSRLNQGIAKFCQKRKISEHRLLEGFNSLFTFIERTEKVDRVLFDSKVEKLCAEIFQDQEELGKELRDAVMYVLPSDFKIHDVIRLTVQEIVS